MKTKILLAEDDINLGFLIKEILEKNGYDVNLQENGAYAWNTFINNNFDLCIFDVMMPVEDGFSLAKKVRKINIEIPIIFLTAKSLQGDKIEGFKLGADDYITKPFNTEELILRISAILKRTGVIGKKDEMNRMQIGKFYFDYNNRTLTFGDNKNRLTTKEAELLKLLFLHKNEVVERNMLLQVIWNDDSYFASRSMDVYINKLRKILSVDVNIEIITVHGLGLKLVLN